MRIESGGLMTAWRVRGRPPFAFGFPFCKLLKRKAKLALLDLKKQSQFG